MTRASQKAILSAAVKRKSEVPDSTEVIPEKRQSIQRPSAFQVLAVLPGIGNYKSSDESDGSSELEDESSKIDLKRLVRVTHQSKEHED